MEYSFAGQLIRNQVQLSEDISQVTERLVGLETQIQTLIIDHQFIIGKIHKTRKNNKSKERKPPEQKLLGSKNQQSSTLDVSRLLHLPEALQKNICGFTENILFTSSSIPDELVSTECLSEDECSSITSKSSQKDQVRLLVRKIKARGPEVIEKFLNTIKENHPELVSKVYKSLDEIVDKNKEKPKCAISVMQHTVDLKEIADSLWEQKIITDNIYGDIIESESLHRIRLLIWNSIINSLNELNDIDEAKSILINALSPKYEHIVNYIKQTPDRYRSSLSCWCCKKSRCVRPRPEVSEFGSQTDVSTTSDKIPKVIDHDDYSDDQSVVSSQGIPSSNLLSYDLPEMFESIGNIVVPQQEIQSSVIDSPTCVSDESTANDENLQNMPTNHQGELNETQNKDKQLLAHSLSIASNASTICAAQSLSSLGTPDDIMATDELQSDFKDHETNAVFKDEDEKDSSDKNFLAMHDKST